MSRTTYKIYISFEYFSPINFVMDNLIRILLRVYPHLPSHYSRVIYNAQHPHHHRLPHTLNQASDRASLYGSPSTNDFATYQNYASTASTVSTLAQFNYNNPESYPYTPTTPLTTVTDISAGTPCTTNRNELSASSAIGAASSASRSPAGYSRVERDGAQQSVKGGGGAGLRTETADDEEPFASIRIQVRKLSTNNES